MVRLTALFIAASLAPAAFAQDVPVHVTVTVEWPKGQIPPILNREDVLVYQDKDRLQVTDWVPLRSSPGRLELWVLIDDGENSNIGVQLEDLRKFIIALKPNVQVGVGYMRNGSVAAAQNPTGDHDLAAKSIRLPNGIPGISASPYLSVVDLIKKWPTAQSAREILMITSGADPLYGAGPENPYLARAIQSAQRAGVVVNAIYYSGSGHYAHNNWRIMWGQNYLAQFADETGGEFFWQGDWNPVSLAPYLDQLAERIDQQYIVTFLTKPYAKGGFERVRFGAEVPHVTLHGPTQVYVAPPGK